MNSREVGVGVAGGAGGGLLAISAKLGFGVVTGVDEKEVRGVSGTTDVRPGVGAIAWGCGGDRRLRMVICDVFVELRIGWKFC